MPAFSASTKDVLDRLGLTSSKTLFRRRTDYRDPRSQKLTTFLQPNVHFRRLSPNSNRLVWDLEETVKAWDQATAIAMQQQ